MVASSVRVSTVPAAAPLRPRPPRAAPPGASFWTTGAIVGSGHSVYGVGLVVLQARLTVVPPATFEVAAIAVAIVTCVASGMLVISGVTLLTVPVALVT